MTHGSVTTMPAALAWFGAWTLLLATPPAIAAQADGPGAPLGTARASIESRAAVDSFFTMLPDGLFTDLDGAVARARAAERTAGNWRARYDRDVRRAREARSEQNLEIDRATRGIRIAEDLGQASRKQELEDDRRLRRRYRLLLDARIEALERAMLAAEAEERLAGAERRRLEVARDLADARNRWRAAAGSSSADGGRTELEAEIFERFGRYFRALAEEHEAAERLAAARRELAEKQADVIERRVDLFDD